MSTQEAAETTFLDIRVAGAPAWQRWYLQNERLVLGLLGLVSVLTVWEGSVQLGLLKRTFVSSPSAILQAAVLEVRVGRIWGDIGVSLLEYTLGFLLATVLGIAFGLVAGWFRRASYVIDPWLSALYATPHVALAPLIIVLLGIDLSAKVFVVFLTALFSIAVNTLVGVRSTDARMLAVAQSFEASPFRIFRTVVLPSTVPLILTGMRLASGHALVGVVVAELIAANQGIGFVISISGATLNTARLMVGVLLLGFFGVFVGEVMRRIERRFDVWRPQVRDI